jgi:hypothetical protein
MLPGTKHKQCKKSESLYIFVASRNDSISIFSLREKTFSRSSFIYQQTPARDGCNYEYYELVGASSIAVKENKIQSSVNSF